MKTILAVLALTLATMSCTTLAQHGTLSPAPLSADTNAAVAQTSGVPDVTPAPPDIPEAKVIDPLARALTSATFMDHAQRSLAIAGTSDPIFTQCVTFLVKLGQELKDDPLITFPSLSVLGTDASCPLCVIAAKRHDLAALQSGDLLARIAKVRARANDIRQRTTLACAPLLDDERNTVLRLGGLLGL